MDKKQQNERADRLQRLGLDAQRPRESSARHSRIIKSLRVILPLSALGIILLLFSWHRIEDTAITPIVEPIKKTPRTIGKNELVNPRFESTDDEGNPYIVTAERALQGQSEDDNLIILEDPIADISLKEGNWLAVKSKQAAFEQEDQRMLLKGKVEMFHDEGYHLHTEEMHIDMKAGTAKNDVKVHVQGPKGTLDAKGLDAHRDNGQLIFKGPAKLILTGSGL